MIPGLKRELESAVSEACRRVFGVEAPRLVLETPPKVELGDLACPVAFELAKVLKRPPRKIAEELAPTLTLPALVVKRTVEGGGYLNFFVDRPKVLKAMLEDTHAFEHGRLLRPEEKRPASSSSSTRTSTRTRRRTSGTSGTPSSATSS